ncbi:DUF5133 domain-containing protein [Streptomyces sp. NPDC001910]|uniref:DUF5133 domain-containing protein n=1 Tax=Streptomyces sp. NPDC001910 TaxID=3154403 RepID=UPI0033349175
MLMPLPTTLQRLVSEYETLLAEERSASTTSGSQRLNDVAYTLCVSTGTREISDALDTARVYLARAATAPTIKALSDRRVIVSPPKQTASTATSIPAAPGEQSLGQASLASATARAAQPEGVRRRP